MSTIQKPAACMLHVRDDGKILAVSRKDNHEDFGLPGGKVDGDEPGWLTVVREVQEETGLLVMGVNSKPIFTDGDSLTGKYLVETYLVEELYGEINTSEPGKVAWVGWEDLFRGSFGNYNRKLHDIYFCLKESQQ